ncbi:hypothetical protein VTJ49DRAFT_2986 [Mycothermus thermophilus]|uniref:Calcineurin-like phosphoesterase domain-containing protein n=1 Tax=Humicola insolens TaxID=85995 RepID=A0ABR3V8S6_HUMIN
MSRLTQRTRIVCISDTHNTAVKLPKGDVLVHAGDLTNQGSYSELSKAVQWLEKADYEVKIVIADEAFYAQHGSNFHNQIPQDSAKCRALLASSRSIIYLEHSSVTVRLKRPDGPRTEFTVFGSPYSPQYGTWAFMYPRADAGAAADADTTADASGQRGSSGDALSPNKTAAALWSAIPLTTDLLITHTPAATHRDDGCGCPELAKTLSVVRPRLHVCGHVHQARGAERVMWDVDGRPAEEDPAAAPAAAILSREPWQDPNPDPTSAKISLVDLTSRKGNRPLAFYEGLVVVAPPDETPNAPHVAAGPTSGWSDGASHLVGDTVERQSGEQAPFGPADSCESGVRQPDRSGRRETCVVNAAIMATGWPHVGGKRLNKPIVVDIDLPECVFYCRSRFLETSRPLATGAACRTGCDLFDT